MKLPVLPPSTRVFATTRESTANFIPVTGWFDALTLKPARVRFRVVTADDAHEGDRPALSDLTASAAPPVQLCLRVEEK
jgi:hypothetical protein